jgi:hypothetical protein
VSDEARHKAWKTRREKYGTRGHSGAYSRNGYCEHCERMRRVIAKLHNAEILSEGQAVKATGMDRVDLRALADEIRDKQ